MPIASKKLFPKQLHYASQTPFFFIPIAEAYYKWKRETKPLLLVDMLFPNTWDLNILAANSLANVF